MRVPVVATLAVIVGLGVTGHGQAPAGQPTFRTATTLVEVSAVVTREGQPVTDLRASEVTVLDNGKPQPIVAFERVDLGRGEQPSERRDFVLVVDDLHIAPASTAPAIRAALAFVAVLGPHDRLAVTNTGPHALTLDMTTDRARARTLLSQVRGQATSGGTQALEAEIRARTAMEVLQHVARSLRSDAAERRAILLISEGHPAFEQESRLDLSPAGHETVQNYFAVLREAATSNVAIYTVDPRGLRAAGSSALSSRQTALTVGGETRQVTDNEAFGSLALLARNTGGVQTRWTNDLTAVFPQILEDSRQYYRIAYAQPEAAAGKRQPATRRIQVEVSRTGVEVRARQRYAPVAQS